MSEQLHLRIKYPWGDEETKSVQESDMVIGRDNDCDIEINDPEVSRRHAILTCYSPDHIKITDLGSTNGTFVKDELITGEAIIGLGQSFQIGDTVITVESAANSSFEKLRVPAKFVTVREWKSVQPVDPEIEEPTREKLLIEFTYTLLSGKNRMNNPAGILNTIAKLVGAENGFMVITDEGVWRTTSSRIVRGTKLRLPLDLLERVVEKGKIISISQPKGKSSGLKSGFGICIPIRDHDRKWGGFYLDRSPETIDFQPDEIELLSALGQLIAQALQRQRIASLLSKERDGLRWELERYSKVIYSLTDISVKSQDRKYQQLLFKAMRIAGTNHPVLISGAPGSGRGLIAKQIHGDSARREKPFIIIDCSAVPQTLIEEELFGIERSEQKMLPYKRGFFEIANEGTLVLHEISVVPHPVQRKIADAIARKAIMRINSSEPIPVDVRVIVTTLVDHNRLLNGETMQQDLFEHFKSSILEVPSLSQRTEDIIPIAKYFLREFLPKNQRIPEFSSESAALMKRYNWPGNLKELADSMRYVAVVCNDFRIELGDLPKALRENLTPKIDSGEPLRKQLDRLEAEIIRQALERNNKIVTRAAGQLGLSESTLRYRMHRLHLTSDKDL